MVDVVLVNRYPRIRDTRWANLVPALQEQVSKHFAPIWGTDANIGFCGIHDKPNPAAWKVWLLSSSDTPGDLGYHEDDTGTPESKIFVADDLKYGAEISVTVSHEILEMLGDPTADKTVTLVGKIVALEMCDAVEADEDGPTVGGFRLSNFVYPARFGMTNPSGVPADQYDYMDLLKRPFPAVRPGGYDLWSDGTNWHTTAARFADGSLSYRSYKPDGRSSRRARK